MSKKRKTKTKKGVYTSFTHFAGLPKMRKGKLKRAVSYERNTASPIPNEKKWRSNHSKRFEMLFLKKCELAHLR
jgi:hypothetical protein